ncbi:ribonuclease H-like protein [Xylaria castorea]|nr:ribonuclease H-like protein [Xylaria castorea]
MDEGKLFCPKTSPQYRDIDESQLVTYNTEQEVLQLQSSNPLTKNLEVDASTVVIHIGDLWHNEKAAWGVYLGVNSRYNAGGITSTGDCINAKIDALYAAESTIQNICAHSNSLKNFIIATDSDLYMVMSFWADNGGKSAKGKPVPFAYKFMPVYNRLFPTNAADGRGSTVRFWYVPEERTEEARELAQQAME